MLDPALELFLPIGLLPGLGEAVLDAGFGGGLLVSGGLRLLERPGLAGAFLVKFMSA